MPAEHGFPPARRSWRGFATPAAVPPERARLERGEGCAGRACRGIDAPVLAAAGLDDWCAGTRLLAWTAGPQCEPAPSAPVRGCRRGPLDGGRVRRSKRSEVVAIVPPRPMVHWPGLTNNGLPPRGDPERLFAAPGRLRRVSGV